MGVQPINLRHGVMNIVYVSYNNIRNVHIEVLKFDHAKVRKISPVHWIQPLGLSERPWRRKPL